jgi:hypothetical protein
VQVKLLGLILPLVLALASWAQPQRPPQAWLARQLLLDALAGKDVQAYQRMDSAGRRRLTQPEFGALAQQLRAQQKQYGKRFSLYRLGMRLLENGPTEYFYSFTFDADTLKGAPHVVLDVAYADSMTTKPRSVRLLTKPVPRP